MKTSTVLRLALERYKEDYKIGRSFMCDCVDNLFAAGLISPQDKKAAKETIAREIHYHGTLRGYLRRQNKRYKEYQRRRYLLLDQILDLRDDASKAEYQEQLIQQKQKIDYYLRNICICFWQNLIRKLEKKGK